MTAAVLVWLLQDLLQVLAMGIMLVPEFFLLMLAYGVVSGSLRQERVCAWIWFAYAGGLLWDLRWASSPGMSSLINVAAVIAMYAVWNRTPVAGRGVFLFAAAAGVMHAFSGIAHYFAWATPSHAAVRMFLIQQLLSVPVLALLCVIYAFRKTDVHV
ncbi:MAG: hypothetical protein LBR87_08065 [Synergistaceae bacterium]|nr:hypothetical protein [Synergistaceae bacterium]